MPPYESRQTRVFAEIDALSEYLNRTCFTGIRRKEFMYTIYPPGAHYERHVDDFQNKNARKFSVVTYLNRDWEPGRGGKLVIYDAVGALRYHRKPYLRFMQNFRGWVMCAVLVIGLKGAWAQIDSLVKVYSPPGSEVVSQPQWLFIQLTNGNWFYGSVVNKTDATIVLETPVLGEVTVQKLDIKYFTQGPLTASERQAIQNEERSKQLNLEAPLLWPRSNYEPDPNATRYFFAPSAFQLDQDEAYYQNSYGLYNQASVGLSPGLTVGTNILAPVAIGFTAKAGFELSEKVRFSMGGLVLFPFWDDPVGLGFANLTFGSENSNVTFTAGTDFQGANIANISFLLPLNEQTWFISENYLIATSNWNNTAYYTTNIFSLGVRRFAMRRGFTWDYALIAIADEGIVLPFYSLTIPIKPKSERL